MDAFFNHMNIFRLMLKWKYHLVVLMVAATGLSYLFSSKLFIKPLYKSFAVLYPSNIFPYSNESETEQMLQLMNSSSIRDSLLEKFQLGSHWGLNPQEKYYQSTLLYLYGNRVSIRKTEFESVVVEVLDTDPKIACDMVNAVIHFYDEKVHHLQKKKFHEVVVNYEQILAAKQKSLDSIQQAIDDLTVGQGEKPAEVPDPSLIKTFADNVKEKKGKEKKKDLDAVKRMRAKPGSKESKLVLLTSLAMSEAEAYSELKLKYDEAMLNDNRNYTYSNIVTSPVVSDKQAFPKQWIIVVFSVLATLLLSLVVISFIENQKKKAALQGSGVSSV